MRKRVAIVDDKFSFEHETQLTVHKTSVFFAGDGFVAYDQNGNLLLRRTSSSPKRSPSSHGCLWNLPSHPPP
ncbi:hypothetical protein K1719_011503 [Acacia pycnantha]|nr:hypothetical protein K1719_011503 [Acacia pycnantha]